MNASFIAAKSYMDFTSSNSPTRRVLKLSFLEGTQGASNNHTCKEIPLGPAYRGGRTRRKSRRVDAYIARFQSQHRLRNEWLQGFLVRIQTGICPILLYWRPLVKISAQQRLRRKWIHPQITINAWKQGKVSQLLILGDLRVQPSTLSSPRAWFQQNSPNMLPVCQ